MGAEDYLPERLFGIKVHDLQRWKRISFSNHDYCKVENEGIVRSAPRDGRERLQRMAVPPNNKFAGPVSLRHVLFARIVSHQAMWRFFLTVDGVFDTVVQTMSISASHNCGLWMTFR